MRSRPASEQKQGPPPAAPADAGGEPRAASAAALRAWAETARPGERFVWLTACDRPRMSGPEGATARVAAALHREGVAELGSTPRGSFSGVANSQPHAGQLRDWWVRKVGARGGRGRPGPLAVRDPAAAKILGVLRRAAEAGRRCPSNAALARVAGLATRAAAAGKIAKLVARRFIRSELLDGPDGAWRVVEIRSNGQRTAAPATDKESSA